MEEINRIELSELDYKKYLNKLSQINIKVNRLLYKVSLEEYYGAIFSKIILIRLIITFKNVKTFILKELAIESFVLMRFIQEQRCYSYSLLDVKNDEDIKKISITKSINKFKERFLINGQFYGELTRYVHLDIHEIGFYTSLDEKTENIMNVDLNHNDSEINYKMFDSFYVLTLFYLDLVQYILELENKDDSSIRKIEKYNSEIYDVFRKVFQNEN